MLRFNLVIRNPWAKQNFKNLWCKEEHIAPNKAYCIEFTRNASTLFELSVDLNISGHDHAGPDIEFTLFGYGIHAQIYDTRHWDDETNTWEIYDDTNSKTGS